LPEENKTIKRIYGYVASAVHYGFALGFTHTHHNSLESKRPVFSTVGFGLGLALQEHSPIYLLYVVTEGKYKLEIQYVWARCMEGHVLGSVYDQNRWWIGTCTKSRHEYHGSLNMSLNDIIRVTVRFHINKNADISNRYP
jgi:hypothetical protein